MKKLLFVATLLLGSVLCGNLYAGVQTDIPLQIIDEGGSGNNTPKGPDNPLIIHQDDNVLMLPSMGIGMVLQLLDNTGVVVYSTFVPAGTTQVVLPTTMTGTYELRLITSTYYYMGYITL